MADSSKLVLGFDEQNRTDDRFVDGISSAMVLVLDFITVGTRTIRTKE